MAPYDLPMTSVKSVNIECLVLPSPTPFNILSTSIVSSMGDHSVELPLMVGVGMSSVVSTTGFKICTFVSGVGCLLMKLSNELTGTSSIMTLFTVSVIICDIPSITPLATDLNALSISSLTTLLRLFSNMLVKVETPSFVSTKYISSNGISTSFFVLNCSCVSLAFCLSMYSLFLILLPPKYNYVYT